MGTIFAKVNPKVLGVAAICVAAAAYYLFSDFKQKREFTAYCMKSPGIEALKSQLCDCMYKKLEEADSSLIAKAVASEKGEPLTPSEGQSMFFVAAQCANDLSP